MHLLRFGMDTSKALDNIGPARLPLVTFSGCFVSISGVGFDWGKRGLDTKNLGFFHCE